MVRIEKRGWIIPILPYSFVGVWIKLRNVGVRVRYRCIHTVGEQHDVPVVEYLTVVLVAPGIVTTYPFNFFRLPVDNGDRIDLP